MNRLILAKLSSTFLLVFLSTMFLGTMFLSTMSLSAGVKIVGDPWVLSNSAKYKALQIDDVVVVIAYGNHISTGYKVMLRKRPEEIYPPMFDLVHTEPGGLNAQVITPFAALGHFKASTQVKQILVIDAQGKHAIPVKQASAK